MPTLWEHTGGPGPTAGPPDGQQSCTQHGVHVPFTDLQRRGPGGNTLSRDLLSDLLRPLSDIRQVVCIFSPAHNL